MYSQEIDSNKRKQNEITEKFILEFTQIKKDRDELLERMEKAQLNYNQELVNEKDKYKKLQQENSKLSKSIKELKNELQNYESKLTKKEMECGELKKRIDTKIIIDDKTKDRDTNIFMKFLGRKPVASNSQDQKLVTILNHFENQKEKLEKEMSYWKKEAEALRETILEQRGENSKLSDEERNKSRFFEKVKEELMNQINQLQEEKERLLDINLRLTKSNDFIQKDHQALQIAHSEMKELYKQLRIDYQNLVHKNQEQYLQFQSITSEKNMNSINQQQQEPHYNDENVNNQNIDNYQNNISQQKLFTQPAMQEPYPYQNSVKHNRSRSKTPEQNRSNGFYDEGQQNSATKRRSDHKLLGNSATSQQTQQIIAAQQEIIQQLCDIYAVESEDELVQCAQKTELVMQAIPKMESLLQQITEIVFGNNSQQPHDNSNKKEKNIDKIVPILLNWKQEIKLIDQFVLFKDKLCQTLQLNEEHSTDKDIIIAIDNLKMQVNTQIQQSVQNQENKQQKQIIEFMKLFEIGEDDNVQTKISQIFLQLNDIQRFIKITKKLLELDEDMRSEACLTYILKLLEKMKLNKYNDPDLIIKIQKALKVDDPVQILPKIEILQKNSKLNTLNNSQNSLKKIQL
ncbi:hypothetical protein TTHERM_00196600 (macronuclear) [Tetrahymena thermophila SB210]|uniref:Centrosomal protein of 70 kDa n=1 Tax=Tetrahymena thermophila (strain SB210) TaxID=312017 RepID=Q23JX4_TETTS|nr:hypothetical protein TTHERM_00196600 [Tetrahymena thermophila SB210]EAR97069.1 hypothetical protein TTHERM_00196600 [Tetrahymena thermophila SB210]|eukprot:XP_001017314.1 hypothetical protein TTHERM_00196600 [Tetrahymena thermophila SB210]